MRSGQSTDELIDAAVRSTPAMVMQKFHNLRGAGTDAGEVAYRFYEIVGPPPRRIVHLSPELIQLAHSDQMPLLREELAARWNIVETSFATGIGPQLGDGGLRGRQRDHAAHRQAQTSLCRRSD